MFRAASNNSVYKEWSPVSGTIVVLQLTSEHLVVCEKLDGIIIRVELEVYSIIG